MELATIHVSGVNAKVVQKAPVPVNIIGGYVDVIFDDDWDGLVRTAVIHGAKDLDVVNVGNRFEIPQETVSESGIRLKVGFYGVSQDGGRGIPTLWADLGVIQEAADPSGDESTDPALPVWAQLEARIGDLNDLDTQAKETIVAAINEALTKGGADPAEVARLVEEYLEQNPITADQIGAVGKEELPNAINEALAQAKASGEFKGEPGEPGQPGKDGQDGKDYVLTPADKTEIAEMAAELVDVPEGSGAVSGTLLPETEVTPGASVKGFGYKDHPVGEKLAVIMDGKPYITTHIRTGEGADAYDFIGNLAMFNPGFVGTEYDTGEPFAGVLYDNFCQFGFADGASHRIAICNVDALDEVYIRALNSLESGEVKEKTDTLTFDGNLENAEKVSMGDVYYLVKLYDGFVERSELVGGTVTLSDNTVRDLTEDNLVDSTESFGVPGYQIGNEVAVAIDGTVTMDGTTLTRGIWGVYMDQTYVKELKAPKAIFDTETEDSPPGNFIVELTTTDGENLTANKSYEEIVTAWGDGLRVLAMAAGEPLTVPLTGLDVDKGDLFFELSAGIFEGAELTVVLTCSPENTWSLIHKAIPTMETVERLAGELMTGVAKVPTASVGQTIKVKSVDENGVPTAWEAVDFPSGGGGEALSEEWTEEVLLSGVLATTDSAGMFDTGLTWADLKKYDMIQFSYGGTISGDVFLGFFGENVTSQWGGTPLFYRGGLQQNGYVRIYLLGGGTVAEVRTATSKAVNFDISKIATISTRDYNGVNSSNLIKIKGAVNSNVAYGSFADDSHLKIYFTNAPTADLTWYLIGGNY